MIQNQHNYRSPIPFLTKYASERTASGELEGYYSESCAMWVVSIDGSEVALIDHRNSEIELATKTKAEQESDDQEDTFAMTELATKTSTQTEQDDASEVICLEMATKTDAQAEHDDTSSEISGMFL